MEFVGAIIGVAFIAFLWIGKTLANRQITACPHCGFDSGVTISRAPRCSGCGKNRDGIGWF
jgi:hypothetical protein